MVLTVAELRHTKPRPHRVGFTIYGAAMQLIVLRDNLSLDEVDQALRYLGQVPDDQRGPAWHAMSDRVLDQRKTLTEAMNAQMHERVMVSPETR